MVEFLYTGFTADRHPRGGAGSREGGSLFEKRHLENLRAKAPPGTQGQGFSLPVRRDASCRQDLQLAEALGG